MDHRFGDRVKQLRQERELSLRKLGEKAGVSYSIMNSIENGRFQPSRESVVAIAKALRYDNIRELIVLCGYENEM